MRKTHLAVPHGSRFSPALGWVVAMAVVGVVAGGGGVALALDSRSTAAVPAAAPAAGTLPSYWIDSATVAGSRHVSMISWTDRGGDLVGSYQQVNGPVAGAAAATDTGAISGSVTGSAITLEQMAPNTDPSLGSNFESGTITSTHLTLRYTLTGVTHTLDYRPGTATQFDRLAALTLAEVAPARRPRPARTEAQAASPTARATAVAPSPAASPTPTPAPSTPARSALPTGALPTAMLLPGCPAAPAVAGTTSQGTVIRVVSRNQFSYDVCFVLPGGLSLHVAPPAGLRSAGASVGTFPGGGYFATDSLGHVFINLNPGNISGVLVIVPQGSHPPLVFGPVPGASVAGAAGSPFTLTVSNDACNPNCASGSTSYHTLVWDGSANTYVYGPAQ
jgi:hypothetical protein